MLLHSCVSVRSVPSCIRVFETLLELPLSYTFEIEPPVMQQLFTLHIPVQVRVYNAGNCLIEVFITPDMPSPGLIQHLCFECSDREAVLARAEQLTMTIRRIRRKNGDVVFVKDDSGNLYELKQALDCITSREGYSGNTGGHE